MSDIKALLNQLIVQPETPLIVAKVTDVDKTNATCEVEPVNGKATMFNVRIKATIDGNDKGLIAYPSKGSYVVVGILEDNVNSAFICLITEVESFKLTIDGNTLEGDKDTIKCNWKKVEFNGGNNDGLILIKALVDDLNKTKKEIRDLKTIFSTWTPVAQDGGAALKTRAVTWAAQPIADTIQSDIEDPNITH